MADRLLGRYAMGDPGQAPRVTGFPVAVGDLSYWDAVTVSDPRSGYPNGTQGVMKSAASYPWQGSLAATQQAFASLFIGLAAQRWPVSGNVPPVFGGQDGYLLYYPAGVAEFDVIPGTVLQEFALVGPDQVAGGGALLPQQVALVGAKNLAIGRVERPDAAAPLLPGKILVRFFSAMMAPLTNA